MASFTVESTPKLVTADTTERKTLTNAGGDPLLWGDESISALISDGLLNRSESVTIESSTWIVSEGQTLVAITTVPLVAEHDLAIRMLQNEVAELKDA